MGPCAVDLPVGFYFHPKDSDLLGYYLHNKIFGKPMKYEVPKINLYGTSEPWKCWKDFGGDGLEIGEDLYFFTTLKTKGIRVSPKAGNGCWHEENSAKVLDPKNEQKVLGFSRRFHYKNPKSDQNGCWILHEYSLKDYTSLPKSKNSSASDDDGGQLVLCRIRKNDQKLHKKNERKRKFKSAAEDHGIDDAPVQSKSKIQKINIDDHDPIGLTSHEQEFVTNPIGLTQSNHQSEMIDDNQLLGDDFDEALHIAFSYLDGPTIIDNNTTPHDGGQLVLCRIRKNDQKLHKKNERKRKFKSAAEDHGIDDAPVQSKSKIQKINIDDHDPIGLTSHEQEFVTNPIGLTQSNHQSEMIDDNQLLGDDFDEALHIAFSYLDGPTIIDNNTTPQMQSYSSMLLCAEKEEMGNTTYTDHETEGHTSQRIATGSEIIQVTADIGFGTSEETSHEYLDIDDQIAQINMSEPDYLQLDDHVFEMSLFDDDDPK